MNIKFYDLPEIENKNFKDGEKEFFVRTYYDGINKIMKGRLEPGASIGVHTHYHDSEIIYFLEGEGTVICDGDKTSVVSGECHYCPKGHEHSLINTGDKDLIFFACVVTQ